MLDTELCQTSKNYHKSKHPLPAQTIPKQCFDEVSLDVVGPVPVSATGSK